MIVVVMFLNVARGMDALRVTATSASRATESARFRDEARMFRDACLRSVSAPASMTATLT